MGTIPINKTLFIKQANRTVKYHQNRTRVKSIDHQMPIGTVF